MTTILTTAEAALVLRCDESDLLMASLLPQVDAYIKTATGVDWTTISPIPPAAKSAARMLLVMWYENPGMQTQGANALGFGLSQALIQLKVEALKFVTFEGVDGGGYITIAGAHLGDAVISVTGILNASGDYSDDFATYVEYEGQIEQTSTENLSEMWFRAYLTPLEDQDGVEVSV